MSGKTIHIQDVEVPRFLYGTAWKEEQTQSLTDLALSSGFTGIDTANQRRHYYEEGVGLAVQDYFKRTGLKRDTLFIQTKYTPANGQDHRKPYDESLSPGEQVKQSFISSLEHLQLEYIDSYVLHGPSLRHGLSDADWEIWAVMEELYSSGQTKLLGISNVNFEQLSLLCQRASTKPHFVQNRCFASTQWDKNIRQLCNENAIVYQGFSLLTANQEYLQSDTVQKIAKELEKSIEQVIFRFALDINIIPITGTRNEAHMKSDLEIYNFYLSSDQISTIEKLALARNK
ncbi:MAG: diketogulonate reductase-like aldo/keto reductase [Chlamydiales bacterium]